MDEKLTEAKHARKFSQERYLELFDFAPLGYCLLNDEGIIQEANLTVSTLLQVERELLYAKAISHFVYSLDQNIYYLYKKKLLDTQESHTCELKMVKKNGQIFWSRLEGIATKNLEGNLYIKLAVIDVTRREVHLLETNQKLKDAHDQLQSFNQSISHDLKSPLNTIVSFTEIILKEHQEDFNEKSKTIFSHITTATKRMSDVLDGLQELSRLSHADLVKEKFDISALVQMIAMEMEQVSLGRKIQFTIQKNIYTYGDSRLITVLMNNLINNAYKYTSKKDIAVIEFGMINIDGRETYFLRDNGAGFDMRHCDKLFLPFERLHTNNDFVGTGIGLASVFRVITRHGGKVWAQSQPDMGATFFFTL
jgi:PAS domain S-box-containing protein